MLDLPRYIHGVTELLLLAGFATLGAKSLRARLLPRFAGAPSILATIVLALAILILTAELLGSFRAFAPVAYLVCVAIAGIGLRFGLGRADLPPAGGAEAGVPRGAEAAPPPSTVGGAAATGPDGRKPASRTLIALAIAALAFVHFAAGAKTRLSTGMTGFDSTWYHGPFAAGFFQSGDTWSLHFIAPQFLAWFYPANGEIFHGVGMLAFGRDIASPLLNVGWFAGCLLACWCIGRPYRVAPWSLVLGAIALSVPALADQAGEARNDVVGIFFLLAAVAIALNARAQPVARASLDRRAGAGVDGARTRGPGAPVEELRPGALVVVGLAAGLAAGTKLNFLLPSVVLVVGLAVLAPRGSRPLALVAAGIAALLGGGYWYLRNLVHSGNPLPWIHHLGPIDLPAPEQSLGGREAHSVLGYLADGTVWSDWLLPGLHSGLWLIWPLLIGAALAGLVLCLRPRDRILALAGLVGLATALAWLLAPTSASGPEGMPRGFESGLRYLAPALVLGLALLPAAPQLRTRIARPRQSFGPHSERKDCRTGRWGWGIAAGAVLIAIAVGYPVQRHYLEGRYADPGFTTPGLNATFAWARDVSGARIATTSTRQYPLFGTDLSNRVHFVGEETPHGGFEAVATCRAWIAALNAGRFDYAVASRDRVEPNRPAYPPQARWTARAGGKVVLKKPPTVVFELDGKLDPARCRS